MNQRKMNKGDLVSVLDEDMEGIVLNIKGDMVIIEFDGIEMEFLKNQLIVIPNKNIDSHLFSATSVKSVIAEKEADDKPFLKKTVFKSKERPIMEVDLHEHQLNLDTKGMTKHEILNAQLDTASHKLEFAIKKNIQKIVFIHGVGEGVLKMELETLFGRYDSIKYYDADYKKYGFGATEVFIFQNPK